MTEEIQNAGNTPGAPSGGTPTTESDGREGLPLNEAALALGISRKALLGRISRNEVEAWKVETKFGPQWRVRVEVGDTQGTPPETPGGHPNRAQATAEGAPLGETSVAERRAWETERALLQDKVKALEKDKDWLQGQVEQRASELERAQVLQMQAQHKVAELEEKLAMMLPAPTVKSEAQTTGAVPEENELHLVPRPWWKFWG